MGIAAIVANSAAVSRHFNERPTGWQLLVVVAGLALLWAGLYYWERYRRQAAQREATPQSLFRDLCAAHELGRTERALLEAVVERKKLEHPAIVFVMPELLRESAARDGPHSTQYGRLAAKLFGASDAETSGPA